MARMQRATIEEAATSLRVIQSAIELQIKVGSLVSCQDPLFWRCVWISGPPKSTLNRRAKPTPKEDKPQNAADLHDFGNSAEEIGLPSEAVALLKTELEITDPAPRQKARASPKKDWLQKVVDLVDSAGPAEEVALPSKIVDLLNTDPEITHAKPKREAKAAAKKCI